MDTYYAGNVDIRKSLSGFCLLYLEQLLVEKQINNQKWIGSSGKKLGLLGGLIPNSCVRKNSARRGEPTSYVQQVLRWRLVTDKTTVETSY